MVVPDSAFGGHRDEFKPPGPLGRFPQRHREFRFGDQRPKQATPDSRKCVGTASRPGVWEEKILFFAIAFDKLRANAAS